jgi:hypothetical protein
MRYKYRRYQGGLLMVNYISMYTKSQKGIQTIGLYGKGNEIISCCSLYIGSCPILSGNCCYMCCHHQSMLHQIYTNWISNDNVCEGLKTIFNNDNIHSFSCVAREKVRNFFLYMNSLFWCDSYNGISKHIMDYNAFTFA